MRVTKPMQRTISRLAVPWGATLAMTVLIAAMAARGPATSRAAQPVREPATTAPSSTAAVEEPRAIVRLVGREFTVTISAGAHGNVFSVRRAGGAIFASNLTLDELRTTQPHAYRQIQPALAATTTADAAPAAAWAGVE